MKSSTTLAVAVATLAALVPCAAQDVQDLRNLMMQDIPGGAQPQNEAVNAGKAPQESYVKLLLDSDSIFMKDGTEIKGTVIFIAAKRVIILTETGEELIDRGDIERIVQRKDYSEEEPVTLPVREIDGFQFIVMEPVEEGQAEAAQGAPQKGTPALPKQPERPAPRPKRKPQPNMDKVKPEDVLKKLKPEEIKELLTKDGGLDELLKKMKKTMDKKPKDIPPPTVKW